MILENQFYTVYGFNVAIIFIGVEYAACLRAFHGWSKAYICKPLRKICLRLFLDLPLQVEVIHGPQINHIKRINVSVTENGEAEEANHIKYDTYISYYIENAFDRAAALHLKKILLEVVLTVFDPNIDTLPGQLILKATHAAIHHSSRFVVFASEAFKKENMKLMEFDAINDTIKSQRTNAKLDC